MTRVRFGAAAIRLAVTAIRARSAALRVVLASAGLLALSFLAFLVEFPKQDGDNIKAIYLLNAVVPLSVAGGWALSRVLRARLLAWIAIALLLIGAYLDVRFLLLPG